MKTIDANNGIKAIATVIVFSIIDNRLCVLVTLPRSQTVTTVWMLPEEVLNTKESAEQTIRKSLSEHFNFKHLYLEQVLTLDSVNPDSSGLHEIDIVYLALTKDVEKILQSSTKYKMAQWRMPGSLPKLNQKHNSLIKILWKKLNDRLSRTDIAKSFLEENFTLSELQETYETILGRDLDTRNFRNKMQKSGLLKQIGKMRGGPNRPAALYSFVGNTKTFLDLP